VWFAAEDTESIAPKRNDFLVAAIEISPRRMLDADLRIGILFTRKIECKPRTTRVCRYRRFRLPLEEQYV
jgi:hypothetical protein